MVDLEVGNFLVGGPIRAGRTNALAAIAASIHRGFPGVDLYLISARRRELVDLVGPPRLRTPHDTHFQALVRAIVYQQLAGRAAATIHGRLIALLEDHVSPERILAASPESLRAVGLSGNKAASVTDLSAKVLDGTVVLDPKGLSREPDEEVITRLTTVRLQPLRYAPIGRAQLVVGPDVQGSGCRPAR